MIIYSLFIGPGIRGIFRGFPDAINEHFRMFSFCVNNQRDDGGGGGQIGEKLGDPDVCSGDVQAVRPEALHERAADADAASSPRAQSAAGGTGDETPPAVPVRPPVMPARISSTSSRVSSITCLLPRHATIRVP